MDATRALLDSLMGPSRDKSLDEQQRADAWKDRNVCKRYLVGFCPNDAQDNWFKNTRRDVGSCTKVHSESLKSQFEQHPDRRKYEADYEKEFLGFLEGLVAEADAWIAREKRNCRPAGKETRLPPHKKEELIKMKEQSEELFKKAEDLAESGNLEGSKEATIAAAKLKEDIDELKEKYTIMSGPEEVCEICGVRCQPGEIADYKAHLDGKLHEGYSKIREKVKELREKERNAPPRRESAADEDRGKGDRDRGSEGGGGGRDSRRDRDRDRKERRSEDRDRRRDRERENKRRSRSRGSRSRSKRGRRR